jgi:hypothetical protein
MVGLSFVFFHLSLILTFIFSAVDCANFVMHGIRVVWVIIFCILVLFVGCIGRLVL